MTALTSWQTDDRCPACGSYLIEVSGPSSALVIQQCRACAWSVTWAALEALQSDCLAATAIERIVTGGGR